MQAAKATPGILKTCGSQKLLDQLTECNKLLESVQKVCVACFCMLLSLSEFSAAYIFTDSGCLFLQPELCDEPQLVPHSGLYIPERC